MAIKYLNIDDILINKASVELLHMLINHTHTVISTNDNLVNDIHSILNKYKLSKNKNLSNASIDALKSYNK